MWAFLPGGFVSAVADKNDPTSLVIRARDYASLRALCSGIGTPVKKIVHGGGTDYPFRLYCSREVFANYLRDAVLDIEYTNFKDEATAVRGRAYHDILLSIWSTTHRLTPAKVQKKLDAVADARWAKIRAEVRGKQSPPEAETTPLSFEEALEVVEEQERGMHALTDAEWTALESQGAPPF